MNDIQEVGDKIKLARKWARRHFNAEQANDTRLVDDNLNFIMAFYVIFPDVDIMRVTPSTMGKPMCCVFEYKLSLNPLQWEANHPIWGYPLPPLKVEES